MRRLSLPKPTGPLTLVVTLSLLSACASHAPQLSARQQASRYAAAAAPQKYAPPGPDWNPWGPYVTEASHRFDVPVQWIRAVMEVESGGQEYIDGQLTTSPAGAMGLMQIMPDTYQELESEYGLGNDPYDPRDNIMAGAAYIHEMYELFGAPGFLAAYNCGPACYENYVSGHGRLPTETRHYVAMLSPRISGATPATVEYAMNTPPRPRPAAPRSEPPPQPIRVAELSAPAPRPIPQPVRIAAVVPPPKPPGGFHFIPRAMADTPPPTRVTSIRGHWAIQVGAFDHMTSAHIALNSARRQAPRYLGAAWPMVESVREPHGVLYRARLVGLSQGAAQQACEELAHQRVACFLVSPAAQS